MMWRQFFCEPVQEDTTTELIKWIKNESFSTGSILYSSTTPHQHADITDHVQIKETIK